MGIRPGICWQPGSIVEYYSNYDNCVCLQSGMGILQAICWHPGSVVDWFSMANAFLQQGMEAWPAICWHPGIFMMWYSDCNQCLCLQSGAEVWPAICRCPGNTEEWYSNEDECICLQSGAEVWPAIWRHPADRVWWLPAAPPCVQGQKRSLLLPGQGQGQLVTLVKNGGEREREKWPTLPGLKVDFVGWSLEGKVCHDFSSVQVNSIPLLLQGFEPATSHESDTLPTELTPVPKVKHSQTCSRAYDTHDFMFKKEWGWLNQKSTILFTRWVSWWVRSLKRCKWGQGKMFFIKILEEDLGLVIISSG